jgi:hypothetical protein
MDERVASRFGRGDSKALSAAGRKAIRTSPDRAKVQIDASDRCAARDNRRHYSDRAKACSGAVVIKTPTVVWPRAPVLPARPQLQSRTTGLLLTRPVIPAPIMPIIPYQMSSLMVSLPARLAGAACYGSAKTGPPSSRGRRSNYARLSDSGTKLRWLKIIFPHINVDGIALRIRPSIRVSTLCLTPSIAHLLARQGVYNSYPLLSTPIRKH